MLLEGLETPAGAEPVRRSMARRRTGPIHHIRCGCASICSDGTWLFSDWAQKELADKTNWMAALFAEACRKHIRSSSPGAMVRFWSHPSHRYVAQAPCGRSAPVPVGADRSGVDAADGYGPSKGWLAEP